MFTTYSQRSLCVATALSIDCNKPGKNLWTRFAAKKTSKFQRKKKEKRTEQSWLQFSFLRVRSGVFLLVCLFAAWKMQTNGKCNYRKWNGRVSVSGKGCRRVASSNGNWSNRNALLMATKIHNLQEIFKNKSLLWVKSVKMWNNIKELLLFNLKYY